MLKWLLKLNDISSWYPNRLNLYNLIIITLKGSFSVRHKRAIPFPSPKFFSSTQKRVSSTHPSVQHKKPSVQQIKSVSSTQKIISSTQKSVSFFVLNWRFFVLNWRVCWTDAFDVLNWRIFEAENVWSWCWTDLAKWGARHKNHPDKKRSLSLDLISLDRSSRKFKQKNKFLFLNSYLLH